MEASQQIVARQGEGQPPLERIFMGSTRINFTIKVVAVTQRIIMVALLVERVQATWEPPPQLSAGSLIPPLL